MVPEMSINKMYLLLNKSTSLFEVRDASDSYDPVIVLGVSFFEMECSTVGKGIDYNSPLEQKKSEWNYFKT